MPRFAFDLEYDGRAFNGSQAQTGLRTLQTLLAQAMTELNGETVQVRPASRLDAEVCAEHLPCDALFARDWQPLELAAALTSRLPADVSVTRVAAVHDRWHAQHDALSKRYRYVLVQRGSRPVLDLHATWVRQLDHPELLHEMAPLLVGRRDLSGFACLRRDDSDGDDPVRTIHAASWTIEPRPLGTYLTFHISGDGFLYKQVRGMVGAMIHVAKGRKPLSAFTAAIDAGRSAERIGNIAPAKGLVLERVVYDPEPAWLPL
ncbi:MAG: tRNA pseudouridine synthase A [Planctomycetes bacterium]|nr:tRNA pseudouridine synthase A [Planctomycetota bacterium]